MGELNKTYIGGLPLGINNLFQNIINKGNIANGVNISLPNIPLYVSPPATNNDDVNKTRINVNINATLTSIEIVGLNTFKQFDMFRPISKYTMNHTFELETLQVSASIKVLETDTPYPHNQQNVLIKFAKLENVKIQLSTLLALDVGLLGKMPLLSLWKHLQGCTIRGVRVFDLTSVEMSFGKIIGKPVVIHGLISQSVDRILNTFITSITMAYKNTVFTAHTRGLANIMSAVIFPILNRAIESTITNLQDKSKNAKEICNSSIIGVSDAIISILLPLRHI
jgi:hypothetical protein